MIKCLGRGNNPYIPPYDMIADDIRLVYFVRYLTKRTDAVHVHGFQFLL
jgi:hypothetical protein